MKIYDPLNELGGRNIKVRYGDPYKGEPLVVPEVPQHLKWGSIHRAWEICLAHAYVIALQLTVPRHAKPMSVRKLLTMGLLTLEHRTCYITKHGLERLRQRRHVDLLKGKLRKKLETTLPVMRN